VTPFLPGVIRTFAGASLFVLLSAVQAAPVQWKLADGGNGHIYMAVNVPGGISWPEANARAVRISEHSHLVTIQSQAENDFVNSLITTPSAWIGGIQRIGATAPHERWRWATGEPLTFLNWSAGEPNDGDPRGRDEVVMEMIPERGGGWNDIGYWQKSFAYVVEWVKPSRVIAIDVKPGSDPNSINPRSNGKIPAAILTTRTFDASTVDTATIQFGNGNARPVWYRLDDVDDDGDLDLALEFNNQDTGIACGDTSATLSAKAFDDQRLSGADSISTVGCKKPKQR
jgi:hypothetical protein